MGHDGIELLRAIEDAFRIHITDDETANVSTVGDLYNLVVSKLQGQVSKPCLTSAAFYQTRRGIVDTLGIDRREVRPRTELQILLPRKRRRETWRSIQAAMKMKLPGLQHPGWIQHSLLTMGVALTVGAGTFGGLGYSSIPWLALLGLFIGGFLVWLTPVLALAFPNHDATVGDLARDVFAINHAQLVDEVGSWNKKDVWQALCRVIVMQTAVAREKVTQETRIVDDLRID